MRTATIVLDEREFVVQELRSRANGAWRAQLEAHFGELAQAIENAPGTDLSDVQALSHLVRAVSGKLLHSIDILTNLVHAYAPDLPLEDAYDSEVLNAFTAILGLAYPFGSVLDRVMSGITSLNQRTAPNSRLASGEPGMTT